MQTYTRTFTGKGIGEHKVSIEWHNLTSDGFSEYIDAAPDEDVAMTRLMTSEKDRLLTKEVNRVRPKLVAAAEAYEKNTGYVMTWAYKRNKDGLEFAMAGGQKRMECFVLAYTPEGLVHAGKTAEFKPAEAAAARVEWYNLCTAQGGPVGQDEK